MYVCKYDMYEMIVEKNWKAFSDSIIGGLEAVCMYAPLEQLNLL